MRSTFAENRESCKRKEGNKNTSEGEHLKFELNVPCRFNHKSQFILNQENCFLLGL